jgi:ribosomal protein S27AE
MPRLTALRAEVGTSDTFETVSVLQPMACAVSEAVRHEHYCTDTDTCDITRAWEDDFPLVAADLLQSATETPLLDAVLAHYGAEYANALALEWPSWSEHFHSIARMCDACGGATFGDEHWTPDECGHCGAGLPELPDDES